ncbi:hypothetical protein BWQ96_10236 [Gracilariopsis chorda]|uniref:Uncharacterized protein n=1 Tax=Gracilariopsis chorda TaxID=448386 RepID=A0A2V3ID99_9FLOR|nr:hypothetical protein BWQ96_10236 [Gracilariopsis chorda]|eukprot:PXF40054.1 hypothetical protein BWQ96_10236 [Gracilariopsis chorda]
MVHEVQPEMGWVGEGTPKRSGGRLIFGCGEWVRLPPGFNKHLPTLGLVDGSELCGTFYPHREAQPCAPYRTFDVVDDVIETSRISQPNGSGLGSNLLLPVFR